MLSTSKGKPSGALFGYLKSLRATIGKFSEIKEVVCVFDGGHSKRRKALYPEYKLRDRNEEVDPDGLSFIQKMSMQMNYLKFILPKLGIKYVCLRGREGDDVVGLLSQRLEGLKIVVSDDKDMFQLVKEDVHLWRPLADERVYLGNFEETAECKREHFLFKKALLGDGSDNIDGIRGVGPKTIDKILEEVNGDIGEYPHVELFEKAMDSDSKKLQALGAGYERFMLNMKLVNISLEEFTEEEIKSALDTCRAPASFDVLKVRDFFEMMEFNSIVTDFPQWITPFQMLR